MVAASERAHKITKADLRELKQLKNPPAGVDSVVFAALGLVGKGTPVPGKLGYSCSW